MYNLIRDKLEGKKIVLLGFGREGSASYRLIRKVYPEMPIALADRNESIKEKAELSSDRNIQFILGKDYLKHLGTFDFIIKTPGISLKDAEMQIPREKITSQSDLFLQAYSRQVVGITGTKGKSTTATLLYQVLKFSGRDAVLLGNIGRPAFDLVKDIRPETTIVFEFSSHQLEYATKSPRIAILLNLYQEHLDAYRSFLDYQRAKLNIMNYQQENDFFIYNADDDLILQRIAEMASRPRLFPFSFTQSFSDGCFVKDEKIIFSANERQEVILDLTKKRKLKGDHNVGNIMAVIAACKILEVADDDIGDGIAGFTGLEHRLQYAGSVGEIRFYNDSIATIPEACMEAVKALEQVDTIILGGFDRGIDYSALAGFLAHSQIRNFIFTGEAGQRIRTELDILKQPEQKLFTIGRFDEFIQIALQCTKPGAICLLSPAAASYNEFLNFEMRGKRFMELIREQRGFSQEAFSE